MKQLLIVKSSTVRNGGAANANDLSAMAAGSIGFFKLSDNSWLNDAPTENFGIALGGKDTVNPFVIPEVDINTLTSIKATPSAGSVFEANITIPTPISGRTYTLVLAKLGTVINGERNRFTQTFSVPTNKDMTAVEVAKKLRDGFASMADSGMLDIVVGGSGAVISITGKKQDEGFNLIAGDDLYGTEVTVVTTAAPAIGDKAFIEKLARECAANKGMNYTDLESQHIYPTFPAEIEDTTYVVYTLRFATGRVAGKQTDERVFQTVHIAIPSGSSIITGVDKILKQPVLANEPKADNEK